jgi:hypothetical protein
VSRPWAVALAVTPILAVALVVRLFVLPPTGPLEPSDAVVLLAGDASTRLPVALRLVRAGSGVLVVSVADGEDNEPARALCDDPGDLTVHCFTADGSDTRGEARAVGRLIAEHGWSRVTVVTSGYHVVRAGLLVRRCTDADVQVADARSRMPLRRWASAVVGEVGGLGAAALQQSC